MVAKKSPNLVIEKNLEFFFARNDLTKFHFLHEFQNPRFCMNFKIKDF